MKKPILRVLVITAFCLAMVLIISWFLLTAYERWFLHEQVAMVRLDNGQVLFADTARTRTQQVKGLSKRYVVPRDGLLFVYQTPQDVGIWMKDMRFPIDIVWISDGEIIHIVENALLDDSSDRDVYRAGEPVDYVFELAAGEVNRLEIEVGDLIGVEY